MPPAKTARLYRLNGIDSQLAFRSDGRNLDCLSVQLTDDAGPLPRQPCQDTYIAIEKIGSMAATRTKFAPPRTQMREQSAAVWPRAAECLAPQREQLTMPS